MAASLAAPDPSGPNSGTRLPPWVSDGETFTRPGVKEVRSGEPGIGHLRHPGPCEPVFLAAPLRLDAGPTRESRHPGHSPGARAAWAFIGNVQAHFESSIRLRMRLDMAGRLGCPRGGS